MKTVKKYGSNTILGFETEENVEFYEIENGCVIQGIEENSVDDFENVESFEDWFGDKYEYDRTELVTIVTHVQSALTSYYYDVYYKLREE